MPDPCPVCRNVNESGATRCLRCGVTFAAIPWASPASAPSSEAVPPEAMERDSRVGRRRVLRRRLFVVLSLAGLALTAAGLIWWQSGAEARRDEKAWDQARASNTTAGYRDYLAGGTLGAHSEEAKNAIKQRLDAAVSRLKSRTNNGNREAVEGFVALAATARDAGASALPIYFVRDIRIGNADTQMLAKQAGAPRYGEIDHALSSAALDQYEVGIVANIARQMRYLGFDELPVTHSTVPVDEPAIRVSYSIRSDGELYHIVSPDEASAAGQSATVYAGMIIRARYEFVVPGSEPLFVFDAEARPADNLLFHNDPYRAMCDAGFILVSLKFESLFNPTPS